MGAHEVRELVHSGREACGREERDEGVECREAVVEALLVAGLAEEGECEREVGVGAR